MEYLYALIVDISVHFVNNKTQAQKGMLRPEDRTEEYRILGNGSEILVGEQWVRSRLVALANLGFAFPVQSLAVVHIHHGQTAGKLDQCTVAMADVQKVDAEVLHALTVPFRHGLRPRQFRISQEQFIQVLAEKF